MRQIATPQGHFFEDFQLNQIFEHGVPRTITQADATLYQALTGSRFVLHCADTVATACGFKQTPLDNWLVFHIAFGKTVNDISLNAFANLGYAEVQFFSPCFNGDTVSVVSEVIGLKENSNGKSGVVYVRSKVANQSGQKVVSWIRWVMVKKRAQSSVSTQPQLPAYRATLKPGQLSIPEGADFSAWKMTDSDNQMTFDEFKVGDQIFHRDGLTLNDSDHSMATRLYQNNARVHFDRHFMQQTDSGKRLVYGGHIISLCRSLSYNGLGNCVWICGVNSGTHANPSFAGDTIYCQSEIIDKQAIDGRSDVGFARVKMLGFKNNTPDEMEFLSKVENERKVYHSDLVLELDYWGLMLR